MKRTTWIILGATSAIASEFAHLAAKEGHPLLLVGRDTEQLSIMASDIRLRYQVDCPILSCDLAGDIKSLLETIQATKEDFFFFIAAAYQVENQALTPDRIDRLVQVNIQSLSQVIHGYMQKKQSVHRMIYLSSVAACRGRAKNSLYGASKAAIEVYLQGMQQSLDNSKQITIARLGFVDTIQTYGLPGIFYASPPKSCALACWKASLAGKRLIYHPFFWRYIMMVISHLPFFIYRRLKR
jgi:short-subunit dehydrogenase